MKLIKNLSLIVIAAMFMTSCEAMNSAVTNSRNGDSDPSGSEVTNEPEDETRPTNEGEGVPGYLVDPDLISLIQDEVNSLISIVATKGAVSIKDDEEAEIVDLEAKVWCVLPSEIEGLSQTEEKLDKLSANLISTIPVEKDGSFEKTIPSDDIEQEDCSLVLTFGGEEMEDAFAMPTEDEGNPVTAVVQDLLEGSGFIDLVEKIVYGTDTSATQEGDGYKWHLSKPSASCTATCNEFGGVNEATINHIGSAGTKEACFEIASDFGAVSNYENMLPNVLAVGCIYQFLSKKAVWHGNPATTQDAIAPLSIRICACAE